MPLANPRLRRLGERPSPLPILLSPDFHSFLNFSSTDSMEEIFRKIFRDCFPLFAIAPYNIFRDDPLALVSSGAATWLLRAGTAATRFENKSRRKERNWLSRLAAIPPGMLIVRNRIENRKPTVLFQFSNLDSIPPSIAS